MLGNVEDVRVGVDNRQRNGIYDGAIDDGAVVGRIATGVQGKCGVLVQWAHKTGPIFPEEKRRFDACVRIARVQRRTADVEEGVSMKPVRAGFGEDFDSSQAEFVELGREGILLDAHLPTGILGRQLSRTEAVDIKGASTCSRRWPAKILW